MRPDTIRITIGLQLPNGMLAIAAVARPEPFMPKPRANPPATIQMTDQLICCKSLAVITPVTAKTAIGISATVLASTPVTLSRSHIRIVTAKVMHTTHMRHP